MSRAVPVDSSNLPVPRDTEIVRFERGAVMVAEHQGVRFRFAHPEPQSDFELLPTILLKLAHRTRRQRYTPSAVSGLGILEPETRLSLLKRAFDADAIGIYIGPRRAKSSPIRHPVARPSDMSGYSLCSFRASLAALI